MHYFKAWSKSHGALSSFIMTDFRKSWLGSDDWAEMKSFSLDSSSVMSVKVIGGSKVKGRRNEPKKL